MNENTNPNNQPYALQMVNICKAFNNGLVIANQNINLNVIQNTIHAVIGENGAGKSTLMAILFGSYEQDSGEIYIHNELAQMKSSKDAVKYQVGMVHQHFKLVDNFTVFQNVILGSENTQKGFLANKAAYDKISQLNQQYNFNLNLKAKVGSLTVGEQQKVEILKILYRDSEILIFDEPTAVLSDSEIKAFLDILLLFKQNNKTILLISHKLYEIKQVADYATIIRKGKSIATVPVQDTSVEQMAEMMVGRKIVPLKNTDGNPISDEVLLQVNNLHLTKHETLDFFTIQKKVKSWWKAAKDPNHHHGKPPKNLINFQIRAGEIFAIAGVAGNGQNELVELIMGYKPTPANTVLLADQDVSKKTIKQRIAAGISYVPEDRQKYGLNLNQNIRYNLVNNQIDQKPYSNYGWILNFRIVDYARDLISAFDIRGTVNGVANAEALSGGNQQKVVIARELQKAHKLLVLVNPTRGLDVGAIEYIHKQILLQKANNKAILLISYELDEILALADTIAVIFQNKFLAVGPRAEMDRQTIGQLLAGENYHA